MSTFPPSRSTGGRCISASTRQLKSWAGKLGQRRPSRGLGLELHCTAPQRSLDDVHQLMCSSNGEELPKNLLVLTMAIGRVLREEPGPSDLCCGVLFLVLSHLMASSSRSARRIVHHSLLEVSSSNQITASLHVLSLPQLHRPIRCRQRATAPRRCSSQKCHPLYKQQRRHWFPVAGLCPCGSGFPCHWQRRPLLAGWPVLPPEIASAAQEAASPLVPRRRMLPTRLRVPPLLVGAYGSLSDLI
jgi:hypothetical protein